VPDPAAVTGSETERWNAFRTAFSALEQRVKLFTSLPIDSLDKAELQERLKAIGTQSPERTP